MNIDTTDQQAVTVAQEDRDAAVSLIREYFNSDTMRRLADDIESGSAKWDKFSHAFARHRLASVSSASAEGIKACIALCEHMEADKSLPDEAGNAAWNLKVAMRHLLKQASASPEPVPGTNQAGEVEQNLEAQRQAIEAAARIADVHAEPTDTPDDFTRGYEIAASKIARSIRKLSPNAALATQPATSQEGTARDAVAWLRAKADGFREAAKRQERRPGPRANAYDDAAAAIEEALCAATPTPPTLSEDLREVVEALEPFAAACNITTVEDSESLYDSLAAEKLTWRDLRRARAVFLSQGGKA